MAKETLIALAQMPEWMGNLIVTAFAVLAAGIGWIIRTYYDSRKEAKRPYKQDSDRFHKVVDAVDPVVLNNFASNINFQNFSQSDCDAISRAVYAIEEAIDRDKSYIDENLKKHESKLYLSLRGLAEVLAYKTVYKEGSMVTREICKGSDTHEKQKEIKEVSKEISEKGGEARSAFVCYKKYGDKLFAERIA